MSKYDGGEITLTDQLKNFPTAEQLQNEFKNKIVEIINYLKKFSAYEVLAYFYSNYKFSYGEKDNKDDRWLQSKKIMYLQMLFSCIEENGIKEELQKNTLEKIEKYIEELEKITLRYRLVSDKEKELTSEEKDYIIHSDSFKDWSGKRYDIFEIQHHKDMLGCLEEEFKLTYNFSLKDLYCGINKLKNNFYFEFENSINNLKTLIKTEKIEINEDNSLNIHSKLSHKKRSQIDKHLDNVYSLKLADIQENTKWTTIFLDKFVIDPSVYKKFVEDISIENWNKLMNNIKYKPLAKIDNKYYILLEQKFYDNFDKIAIKGICEKFNSKEQEIRAKFTSNIEKVVERYFNNILGDKQSYQKNFYVYNNKILENDILIIYDNNIFIIEVKAGNFTHELASEDFESHKESLKNLIVKANEQQDSLEKCLLEHKKICIYDSNNKKTRNKKAEIKINDDTKIFKIIITAESFNDIEARIDKVKILTLSENTLVFCLDDLRVYSEYFEKHPCYFIQYLLQRRKAIGNKNIDLVDELYHLGMWIEYNFYNEYTNEQIDYFKRENDIKEELGIVSICGEDWMEELDAYYNSLWFKKKIVTKPYRNIPSEIKKVIEFCEKNNAIENHTYLTTFLLNLNPDTLQLTEKIVIESKEFYKKNNRPKYGYMSLTKTDENGIDGICISSICSEDDANEELLLKNVYANMYLDKDKKTISVFLYYNKNDEIIKIHLKTLTALDNEFKSTETINMAEYLRHKRGLKLESKKIGRNELCPCGSGKKYKKCCGK